MKLGALLGPDVLEILKEDPASAREGLRAVHPADIVDLLDAVAREDRIRVLEVLQEEQLGETLTYLGGETLRDAMLRLPPAKLAKALDALEPDDAARLLSFLSEQKRVPVLQAMSARDAAAARGLLSYDEGCLPTPRTTRCRGSSPSTASPRSRSCPRTAGRSGS